MKVEFHNNLGQPEVREATRVVVYDGFGNPISVVLEYAPNLYLAMTADHEEFNAFLRQLGIDRTVVCGKLPANTAGSLTT